MRLFKDLRGAKTYATEARAEKAAEEFAPDMRYVLLPYNDRYAICFLPTKEQMWRAGGVAHNGFCVAGGG